MNGGESDALHHAKDPLQDCLRDHAAPFGDHQAQKAVNVDSLSVHDIGRRDHLDDLAKSVAVVHTAAVKNGAVTGLEHTGDGTRVGQRKSFPIFLFWGLRAAFNDVCGRSNRRYAFAQLVI